MINDTRKTALKDLRRIPGVGPSIADDLYELGYRAVSDLRGADPERMYGELCRDGHVDRCVLYVFRCAVYFAERREHDPALLKWWNWTDDRSVVRRGKREIG